MRLILSTALAVMLVGCTTAQNMSRVDDKIGTAADDADAALSRVRSGELAAPAAGLRVIEDQTFVPSKPILLDAEVKHAPMCQIAYKAEGVSLLEFAQNVSKVCGVMVRVTPDAMTALRAPPTSGSAPGGQPNTPPGMSLPPPPAYSALPNYGGSSDSSSAADDGITISYNGDLTGLLNAVTTRQGVSWRYRDNVVSIFYLDTRGFRVFGIATETQMDSVVKSGADAASGISSGGSGGGGGSTGGVTGTSTSQQVTQVKLQTNQFADLKASVSTMLTPNVGRMSLSTSSGILTVTDTPEVLDRIDAFVKSANEFATQQVLLNVKVVSVLLNDSDEMGINWELIYQNLADSYGIGLANKIAASKDAISGSVNILEGSSRFSGSQLIVNALSKQGKVSVVTQPSVTTLNMEPVPVQVAKQTSYLAQTQTTLTNDVGSQTTLTPGTVTTGFNMNLLPYILPDGRTIILQYSVNLSTLNDIRRIEAGTSAIEMPEVDNRILSQKVRMKTGETLVLSGFEQTTDQNGRIGAGNPKFWALGGGFNAKRTREVLVVFITPLVTG